MSECTRMRFSVDKAMRIDLGRQGENLARTIEIDVSSMLARWPEAIIVLLVMRRNDNEPYVANTTLRGGVLYWQPTSADTAYYGDGKIEVRAMLGDVLAKSALGTTHVTTSLTGSGTEPPDPMKGWLDTVVEAGESAKASAQDAQEGAEQAAQAAERAQAAAERAENAAGGGTGGGATKVQAATEAEISNRSSDARVITPSNLDYAVKAAMADGKGVAWTEYEKAMARERIGIKSTASDIYSSIEHIASIVRTHNVEENALIFPFGDQIIVPWKDMDDPNHNTDRTAYQVAWDIVHHGMVTLQDGSIVPGMYLMMHLCSAYGVQFSHPQAFYQAKQELPAGTYHVNFGVGYNGTFKAGTSGQFTLANAVPVGGRLCFSGANVQVFTTSESAAAAETAAMTIGSEGTDLGTITSNTRLSDTGLNAMHRILYGHNRWSTSAIRQYLHGIGTNWYSSKEDFDIRPDQYNKHGFMSGFGSDFLNAIKPVKVTTALNTVEGFANATDDTYDTFFLPSLEQINATPQLRGVEGDYFEYWRRRLGLSDFAAGYPTIYDAYKIPAINANSPQYVRLRSASRGDAHNTWTVLSSGYVGSTTAATAARFSPVCVIC